MRSLETKLSTAVLALTFAVVPAASATSQWGSGAPYGPAAAPAVEAPVLVPDTPAAPAVARDARPAAAPEALPDGFPGASGMTASRFLARLPDESRDGARIQLELARGLDGATMSRAGVAETDWAAGRFDEAIDAVRALEQDGVHVNVAVSYTRPRFTDAPTFGSNVQIATDVAGEAGLDTAVDIDRHTGNFLALGVAPGSFQIYLSTDSGYTWAPTANWCCGPGAVDLTAVGGFGYITYDSPSDTELRMRRVYGTDGTFDGVYFYQPILAYTTPTVVEVASSGNGDDFDNRIYPAAQMSNGTLRWWWSDASTATAFNAAHPTTAPVSGGLSNARVAEWSSGNYDFLSFRGTDNAVYVYGYDDVSWTGGSVATGVRASTSTSISSFRSTVLVAYDYNASGETAAYMISYAGGAGWSNGTLFDNTEGGDYYNPLVSARSGTGTAGLAQEEAGTFDNLVFKDRHNYAPGSWSAIQPLNDVDFLTGTTSIDFEYLFTGWGVTYLDNAGAPWFMLSRAIYYSGFERGDTTEWSSSVP